MLLNLMMLNMWDNYKYVTNQTVFSAHTANPFSPTPFANFTTFENEKSWISLLQLIF